MRNSKLNAKTLAVCLVTLMVSMCITSGVALNVDFTFDIEAFKEKIQASEDTCWEKPAQNRKDSMCNKLTALQELINEGNFYDAYDKLLHDIKPKLTGLKTDELEHPWGNGVYKKPWVTCPALREEFRVECNFILSQINPLAVYDDDKTPPEISIIYEGVQYIDDPGVWHLYIEDLESGLDLVTISVNGIEELYDLQGQLSISYDILVPAIIGINNIEVTATNDDKEFVGDQETSTESGWVEIFADLTPPIIDHPEDIEYAYESTGNTLTWLASDDHPDTFIVLVNGGVYESGEWESGSPITISIDGLLIGSHEVTITVYDTYGNYIADTVLVSVHEADDTPPEIYIQYDGTHTTHNPGEWKVYPYDEESGLGEVYIQLSFEGEVYYEIQENLDGIYDKLYEVPLQGIVGIHTIKVIVKNDINYDGVQETNEAEQSAEIEPYIPPEPEPQDDYTPPEIEIYYEGGYTGDNPGTWTVEVKDSESGLDDVLIEINTIEYLHDTGLNGINTKTYWYIPVPSEAGIHTIKITAVNDIAYDGVQETGVKEHSVEIDFDDDTTGPLVLYQYSGELTTHEPGEWTIYAEDLESGLAEMYIQQILEGDGIYNEINLNLGGVIKTDPYIEVPIPAVVGFHTIIVTVINNDIDREGDQESTTITATVEIGPYIPPDPEPQDDYTPPEIELYYEGGYTGDNPGTWSIRVTDSESGLDDVLIEIDTIEYLHDTGLNGINTKTYWYIPVPSEAGIHTIKITAINDIAYDGVQETGVKEHSVEIDFDDDTTGPLVLYQYVGTHTEDDPGEWKIYAEDLESGLAEIYIQQILEGDGIYNEIQINLGGVFKTDPVIEVPIPGVVGFHTIIITVINNDIDREGDQESTTITTTVEIEPYIPPVPGDYDDTPPEIYIQYEGTYTEDNPGYWVVYLWDEESGLGEVYITISFEGEVYYEFQENLDGIYDKLYEVPLQGIVGIHTLNVIVKNDINYDGVQETSEMEKSLEILPYIPPDPEPDDDTPPNIYIQYQGTQTEDNPGLWSVNLWDYESGLGEVYIQLSFEGEVYYEFQENLGGIESKLYEVPLQGMVGIHTIKVIVKNDINYDGVQETTILEQSVEIEPYIPPQPS